MDEIWAIVLAAGASTRMKTQKLLLPFNGKTIIETVIQNVALSVKTNIMVVLGSHRYEISRLIGQMPVKYCVNTDFINGMLSSVICGFRALPEYATAALIFLGDQPQISGTVAKKVIEAWRESKKGIIIPTFNGRRGHPSLIATKYIAEIEKLDHERGLRSLFIRFEEDIYIVECNTPEILRDIDTPEDYRFEINKNSKYGRKNSI